MKAELRRGLAVPQSPLTERPVAAQTDRKAIFFAAVALGLLVLVAADTFRGWFHRIGSPADLDYGPAQLALRVSMMLKGGSMYGDFRVPPYVPLPYGPIVPVLAAALSRMFGPGAIAALEGGRLLTICSTIIACALIFFLARSFGNSRAASAIASIAFLVSPIVQIWGFEFRVDMPSLAAQLGGLYLFQIGFSSLAIGVLAAAFFIKQFQPAGMIAIVLFCWFRRDRRSALWLGAEWLGAIGLAVAALAALLPNYWLNNFGEVASFHDFGAVPRFLDDLMIYDPGFVALAALALFRARSFRDLRICFLCGALIQDSVSSIHWGSNVYYFMTTLAALALFLAPAIDRLREQVSERRASAQIVFAALIAFAFVPWWATAAHGVQRMLGMDRGNVPSHRRASDLEPEALRRLGMIHRPVLTDISELAMVNPSGNAEFIELMQLGGMRAHGLFDDSGLIEAIRSGEIGGFALDRDLLDREWRGRKFFWPALRKSIAEDYELVRDSSGRAIGPPYLMVPKAESLAERESYPGATPDSRQTRAGALR